MSRRRRAHAGAARRDRLARRCASSEGSSGPSSPSIVGRVRRRLVRVPGRVPAGGSRRSALLQTATLVAVAARGWRSSGSSSRSLAPAHRGARRPRGAREDALASARRGRGAPARRPRSPRSSASPRSPPGGAIVAALRAARPRGRPRRRGRRGRARRRDPRRDARLLPRGRRGGARHRGGSARAARSRARGTVRGKILAVGFGLNTIGVLLFASTGYVRYRADVDREYVAAAARAQERRVPRAGARPTRSSPSTSGS